LKSLARLLALTAISAALVAAGCGDDDGEPTGSTTTAAGDASGGTESESIEAWRERADQICAKGNAALTRAATQAFGGQQPSQTQAEAFASDVAVPSFQQQHDAIAALPKPEAEAEKIDAMLSSLQTGINQVTEDPGALLPNGDSSSAPAIGEATSQAQELGLKECGAG
jgi:hypothetical protein